MGLTANDKVNLPKLLHRNLHSLLHPLRIPHVRRCGQTLPPRRLTQLVRGPLQAFRTGFQSVCRPYKGGETYSRPTMIAFTPRCIIVSTIL